MVGVSCSCRGSRLVRSVGSVAAFVCVETGLRVFDREPDAGEPGVFPIQ